jgi:hypothetical protein
VKDNFTVQRRTLRRGAKARDTGGVIVVKNIFDRCPEITDPRDGLEREFKVFKSIRRRRVHREIKKIYRQAWAGLSLE